MSIKQIVFCVVLGLSCVAGADLQTDMVSDRLDRLDREMTLIQKKIFAEPKTVPVRADGPSDLGEVYTQLDEQNRVIADLTRKVEEMTHAQDELRAELNLMRQDAAVRSETEKKLKTPPEKPQIAASKPTDKEAYDAAYDLLIKTKYPEAEQALRAFLTDYPDSPLIGNANYWLGETFYVRGQYEVAAGIFSDGLTKYEKNPKAADNLLKLGLSMAQLNKKTEACGFLTLLPEKYPNATATLKQRAAQEAKKLSCP